MALLSFRKWVVFQPSFELGLYQFTWCVYCKGKCWWLSLEEVSRDVWVCQLPLAITGSEERIYVRALPPTPWTTHSLPTFLSPLLITLRVACRVAPPKDEEKGEALGFSEYTVHPRKLTWQWKITILHRKYIFNTSTGGVSIFHISFRGCTSLSSIHSVMNQMVAW